MKNGDKNNDFVDFNGICVVFGRLHSVVGADRRDAPDEGENKLSRCASPRRTLAVSFFLRGCISAICTYYGLQTLRLIVLKFRFIGVLSF